MIRFKRSTFLEMAALDRAKVCRELGQVLTERLKELPVFHEGVYLIVSELRELGHELWSYDDSDEMEIWGPNYEAPSGPGIVVTFAPDGVSVEWTER